MVKRHSRDWIAACSISCLNWGASVDHGYRIVMARDAVCSSSDASHDAIVDLFHRRFDVQVEVADVAEILDVWRPR
jgi:nicotinamidase-related amidase